MFLRRILSASKQLRDSWAANQSLFVKGPEIVDILKRLAD